MIIDSNKNLTKVPFFLIMSLFFYTSCNEASEKKSVFSNQVESTNLISYNVIDSIECDFVDNLMLVGDIYKDSLIATFNAFSGNVRILNMNGELLSFFNNSGYDNQGMGQFIGGITFLNNGSLMILSDVGFYNYSIDGELLNYSRHSDHIELTGGLFMSGQLKLHKIRNKDEITGFVSLINLTSNSGVNQNDFYSEVKLINKVDYPSFDYLQFLEYPKESIYLNSDGYYHNLYPLFSISGDSILNVIFNLEGILYQYDLKSLKLIRILHVEPSNFNICSPFKFGTSSNDFLVTLKSDYYTNIFSQGDTILLTYQKWNDPNNEIKTRQDYSSEGYKYREYYLQVIVENSNQQYEMKLPENYPYLSAYNNGKLYLTEEKSFKNVEPNSENILVVKLNFE